MEFYNSIRNVKAKKYNKIWKYENILIFFFKKKFVDNVKQIIICNGWCLFIMKRKRKQRLRKTKIKYIKIKKKYNLPSLDFTHPGGRAVLLVSPRHAWCLLNTWTDQLPRGGHIAWISLHFGVFHPPCSPVFLSTLIYLPIPNLFIYQWII